MIAMPNASNEFDAAVRRGDGSYDPTSAISQIYNSARFTTVAQGFIQPSLKEAVQASNRVLMNKHFVPMLSADHSLSPTGIRLILEGIQAKTDDIHPFFPGIRYYSERLIQRNVSWYN